MNLVESLIIVSKCVPKNDLIKPLSYILFNNGKVVGYNGSQALIIKAKEVKGLSCAVPASVALPLFKSFGKSAIELASKGDTLLVTCGGTKAKLSTMPASGFMFDEKSVPTSGDTMVLETEFFDALEDCAKTVDDKEVANRCGVYLLDDDGTTVMYSSDGFNISRYLFSKKLIDVDIMLPDLFCQLLLSNREHFEGVEAIIANDSIAVKTKGMTLYTQLPMIDNIPDFKGVYAKYDQEQTSYITIDENIIDAVERSTILLTEDQKPIELTLSKGTLTMFSESNYGTMNIPIKVDSNDSASIVVDGVYLEPFVKQVVKFTIKQHVIVGKKDNYSRITAGIVKS